MKQKTDRDSVKPVFDKASLDEAARKNRALNEATDTLNQRLKAAENALILLNLGVTAWVPIANGGAVGWRKLNDVWCLVWLEDGAKTTELRKCSRSKRAAGLMCLERLVGELISRLDVELEQVCRATAVVDALLDEFKKAGLL